MWHVCAWCTRNAFPSLSAGVCRSLTTFKMYRYIFWGFWGQFWKAIVLEIVFANSAVFPRNLACFRRVLRGISNCGLWFCGFFLWTCRYFWASFKSGAFTSCITYNKSRAHCHDNNNNNVYFSRTQYMILIFQYIIFLLYYKKGVNRR